MSKSPTAPVSSSTGDGSPPKPATGPLIGLKSGTKLGKYEIVGRLGLGGMALVYKGYDPLLDRFVAIKQIASHLAADPRFMERFRKEAQILAKLGADQASVVQIYELIEDPRGLFIIMEYVEGQTLDILIGRQNGPMPIQFALQILWHLTVGLRAIHQQSVIHRDIKPSNVMVGVNHRCKITDFGVAARSGGKTSMTLGTTKYMAPELFGGGDVDGRADIYSLGCIAYEMLLGNEKFRQVFKDILKDEQSESLRWMKWHTSRELMAPLANQVNPEVPEVLGKIVAKMMAKNPEQRFASAEHLLEILKRHFTQQGQLKKAAAATARQAKAAPAVERRPEPIPQRTEDGLAIAAPAAPLTAERTGGPATTVLPKRKLTRRQRLIMLGTLVGVIAIALIVMGWISHSKSSRLEETVNASVAQARQLYDSGDSAKARAKLAPILADPRYARTEYVSKHYAQMWMLLFDSRLALEKKDFKQSEDLVGQLQGLVVNAPGLEDFVKKEVEPLKRALSLEKGFDARMVEARQLIDRGLKARNPRLLDQANDLLLEATKIKPGTNKTVLKDDFDRLAYNRSMIDYLKLLDRAKGLEKDQPDEATRTYQKAQEIFDTQEIRDRLGLLDKQKRFTDLVKRAEVLAGEKKFGEALTKYKEANDLLATPELAELIRKVGAKYAYSEAIRAFNAGQFATAQDWAGKLKELAPELGDTIDREVLDKIKNKDELSSTVRRVQDAFNNGRYEEVPALVAKAQGLGPDSDTAAKLADLRKQSNYRLSLKKAEDAVTAGNFAEAKNAFTRCRGLAPDGDAQAHVDKRIGDLDREQNYRQYRDAGEKLFAAGKFDEARTQFVQARNYYVAGNIDTKEIDVRINEAWYCGFMQLAKSSLAQHQWRDAEGWLTRAIEKKPTNEAQSLLNQAHKAIEAEEKAQT